MEPTREIFELQALEIIYLAALIGKNSFPGLEIHLEDETENKQRALMNAQRRSLEAKGYLEIDFMGLAKVNEVLRKCIAAGSNCTSYLCQLVQREDMASKIYYFDQDETQFELEHQPETHTYKMQEIYAQHELMFQIIERIPLVQYPEDNGNSQQLIIEDPDYGVWAERLLQAGASISSLAEIQCIHEEAQVIRELNVVIHEDMMWLLQRGPEDQIIRDRATLSTAMEELCLWLQ
ncbi:hypothetical protein QW71_26485 [Paenibacillus sp. IHB B 3415]|uniref:hypothetical protein n=1 Tax=Paenibacillus sp. IHB B 3415 TaxID=867080 RepID=UPI000575CE35|nr:hypothetical protein [Paenibacillus sp. IHB B 3415]KHL92939.1 hypothetical protein QW71_26485 [Paenibacillus sp. IHB B 3415]